MPHPVVDPTFLPRLERTRVAIGWTLAELADALGTHERTVYRWRGGTGAPSRATAERLATLAALADALARVYGAGTPALRHFLDTPHPLFDGRSPGTLLRSGQGALVDALLRLQGRGAAAPAAVLESAALAPRVRSADVPGAPHVPGHAQRASTGHLVGAEA